MRTRPTHLAGHGAVVGAVLVCAACANSVADPDEKPAAVNPDPNNPVTAAGDENAPPHSLGTITLGEQHAALDGLSTPLISATFLPDSKLTKACTRKVGACEVTQIPKCMTGPTTGCAAAEICTFDDICQPKCVKACTRACGAGEECYFNPTSTDGSGMDCRKTSSFDAGAIAFSGTTQAISLFPPYSIHPTGNGAPFLPGTDLRVVATGAKEVGYEKFEEKFRATSFLETSPSLRKLSRSVVFGGAGVPVGWAAGEDAIFVTASGPGGVASCRTDDKAGTYELARAVIDAAVGESTTATATIVIAVTRERKEIHKEKKLRGSLPGVTLPTTGWLELVTRSSEVATFTSCGTAAGVMPCGELCVNTTSDPKNCGSCGKLCTAGLICSASVCR